MQHESKELREMRTSVRVVSIAVCSFLFAGCVTQEGTITYSSELGVEEIVEKRTEADAESQDRVPTNLVVVGPISLLRPISGDNVDEIYSRYAEFAETVHPDTPALYDRDTFLSEFAGWSKVKTSGIPMIYAKYEFVLIPRDLSKLIEYPTRAGAFVVQDTGDLVAARTNADGYFVVFDRLCTRKPPYAECADQFHIGHFDGITGVEIDPESLLPRDSGKRIDPQTLKRVETVREE